LGTGSDFISIAEFWIANKKHCSLSTICAMVLWCIWKHSNALIFDSQTWLSLRHDLVAGAKNCQEPMLAQMDLFTQTVLYLVKYPCALMLG
jgi:hypothetical protein